MSGLPITPSPLLDGLTAALIAAEELALALRLAASGRLVSAQQHLRAGLACVDFGRAMLR